MRGFHRSADVPRRLDRDDLGNRGGGSHPPRDRHGRAAGAGGPGPHGAALRGPGGLPLHQEAQEAGRAAPLPARPQPRAWEPTAWGGAQPRLPQDPSTRSRWALTLGRPQLTRPPPHGWEAELLLAESAGGTVGSHASTEWHWAWVSPHTWHREQRGPAARRRILSDLPTWPRSPTAPVVQGSVLVQPCTSHPRTQGTAAPALPSHGRGSPREWGLLSPSRGGRGPDKRPPVPVALARALLGSR